MDSEEIITVAEAAKRLSCTKRTIRHGVSIGMLKAKYGGLAKRIVGIYAGSVAAIQAQNEQTIHPATR